MGQRESSVWLKSYSTTNIKLCIGIINICFASIEADETICFSLRNLKMYDALHFIQQCL